MTPKGFSAFFISVVQCAGCLGVGVGRTTVVSEGGRIDRVLATSALLQDSKGL